MSIENDLMRISTDNQNGRHLATIFFFRQFFLFTEFHSNLVYRFSGSASLLTLSIFMRDRKRGYGGHFDFINFQLNALKLAYMGF